MENYFMKTNLRMSKKISKNRSPIRSSKKQMSKSQIKDMSENDIRELILKDHEPLKKMTLVLTDSEVGIAKKRTLYAEFKHLLLTHSRAEEESLYLHMRKESDLKVNSLEAETEHGLAKLLMSEIMQIENDNDLWTAKVKVLAELVSQHFKIEEKNIFKKIKKEFDAEERAAIGKDYQKILSELRHKQDRKIKYTEKEVPRYEYN
jgi:hemerythrin superfamily protein